MTTASRQARRPASKCQKKREGNQHRRCTTHQKVLSTWHSTAPHDTEQNANTPREQNNTRQHSQKKSTHQHQTRHTPHEKATADTIMQILRSTSKSREHFYAASTWKGGLENTRPLSVPLVEKNRRRRSFSKGIRGQRSSYSTQENQPCNSHNCSSKVHRQQQKYIFL